jgi:hypothetical protein
VPRISIGSYTGPVDIFLCRGMWAKFSLYDSFKKIPEIFSKMSTNLYRIISISYKMYREYSNMWAKFLLYEGGINAPEAAINVDKSIDKSIHIC